jgi:hypothetical protein
MKKYDWDKLFTLGENRAKYFKWVADPIVEATVVSDDENKKTISYLSAVDMAIGEAVTKNKHIMTGVGIGAIGTILAFGIYGRIKHRRNAEEEVVMNLGDVVEMKERSIEIEKEKLSKK